MNSLSLTELLGDSQKFLPQISLPVLGDSVPIEGMDADFGAVGKLVDASGQALKAYHALHLAYRGLEVYYYHPLDGVVLAVGFEMDPVPDECLDAFTAAFSDGKNAAKAGLDADPDRNALREAIDIYNGADNLPSKQQYIVTLLVTGCKSLNWAAQSITSLAVAFLSAVECRRQILDHRGSVPSTEIIPEEETARLELIEAIHLYQECLIALGNLSRQ